MGLCVLVSPTHDALKVIDWLIHNWCAIYTICIKDCLYMAYACSSLLMTSILPVVMWTLHHVYILFTMKQIRVVKVIKNPPRSDWPAVEIAVKYTTDIYMHLSHCLIVSSSLSHQSLPVVQSQRRSGVNVVASCSHCVQDDRQSIVHRMTDMGCGVCWLDKK